MALSYNELIKDTIILSRIYKVTQLLQTTFKWNKLRWNQHFFKLKPATGLCKKTKRQQPGFWKQGFQAVVLKIFVFFGFFGFYHMFFMFCVGKSLVCLVSLVFQCVSIVFKQKQSKTNKETKDSPTQNMKNTW